MNQTEITARALELGFAKIYFVKPYSDEGTLLPGLVRDPLTALPAAKTVIVLLMPYLPARETDTRDGVISPYYAASNAAYRAAKTLAGEMEKDGCTALSNVQFPLKPLLIRSGIGRQGSNSLVHVNGLGSAFHVQTILTDAAYEYSVPAAAPEDLCRNCGACVRACPVHAIGEDHAVDRTKCLRAVSEEDPIPPAARPLLGNRLLGCDICQNVCPYNAGIAGGDPIHVSLSAILDGDIENLKAIIGTNYARRNKLMVKAAVAAGNLKRTDLIPKLEELMRASEAPSVREACLWALNEMEADK